MNKKIFIFIIAILILISGGVFLWWENRETPPEKWDTVKMSERGDYNIDESAEGKTIVKNRKAGLSFEVPEGWIIKESPSFITHISFYSPNTKFDEIRSDILQKGCRIYVETSYIKTNLNALKGVINEEFLTWSSVAGIDKFQKIEISNYTALEYIYSVENIKMSYVVIYLPSKDKLYKIQIATPSQEKSQCRTEFDKFLETVLID